MRYTVVLVPDERAGGYVAYVPALGCTTEGETVDEAIDMAHDAAEATIASMVAHGEDVPTEPAGAIVASVAVPVSPAEDAAA